MFPVTSRYYGIATMQTTTADRRTVVYLRRRFLPSAASATTLVEHTVVEGDRLDNVTARYLGDPEQFWRVCDANNAMQPEELTSVIGRQLNIPLPQGS